MSDAIYSHILTFASAKKSRMADDNNKLGMSSAKPRAEVAGTVKESWPIKLSPSLNL